MTKWPVDWSIDRLAHNLSKSKRQRRKVENSRHLKKLVNRHETRAATQADLEGESDDANFIALFNSTPNARADVKRVSLPANKKKK